MLTTTQRSESKICLHNIAEQASGLKCETFITHNWYQSTGFQLSRAVVLCVRS